MNYNEKATNGNVVELMNGKIKNNNTQNKSELENLREVIDLDKKQIIDLTRERDWYRNEYQKLYSIVQQYTTIGLNNIPPYNQVAVQQNANLQFFKQLFDELLAKVNNDKFMNILTIQNETIDNGNKKLIEEKEKRIEEKDSIIKEKNEIIKEKDTIIKEKNEIIKNKNEEIHRLLGGDK